MPIDAQTVNRWLELFAQAWSEADANKAVQLFSKECILIPAPFAEPVKGRIGVHQYWQTIVLTGGQISFESDLLAIQGAVAIANWRAKMAQTSGEYANLDGIMLIEFDEQGLCCRLRTWSERRSGYKLSLRLS